MTKIYALSLSVVLIVADQLIKIWLQAELAVQRSIEVIPGLFYLTYVENRGAAFGIMQGQTTLLSVLVSIVLVVALYMILTNRIHTPFLVWSLSLVIAGGAGNLVDRIVRHYVIDYLDFSALFGFPVFNFADCCVVIGTILILIYILFFDVDKTTTKPLSDNATGEEQSQ